MHPDLLAAKGLVYDACGYTFNNFWAEDESSEYAACTFTLNDKIIKFRSAKITPTKTGLFVTLWKRNSAGITQPHDDSDPTDLFVISVRKNNLFGQFIFPKQTLIDHGILSTPAKEGKRGFRVYPPWDITANKQAQKTQNWQMDFFLEINEALNAEQLGSLYS